MTVARSDSEPLPLVLWAACVAHYDLLSRAEALVAGRFSGMSVLPADIARLASCRGWSLRRIASELRARDAHVAVIDPYLAWYPNWALDAGPYAALLNASSDTVLRYADVLGAESITVVAPFGRLQSEPLDQVVDALGAFADVAAAHGLRIHLEMVPTSGVSDLPTALAIIQQVDRPQAGLVLDTFHLARSGCDPVLLRGIALDKIFHVQLCDGPLRSTGGSYFDEAVTARVFPGEGEMPVAQYVTEIAAKGALPPIGPEVISKDLTSMTAADAGRVCAERVRRFLLAT